MLKPFLAVAILASIVGCASGSPPSSFERTAYNVTTNYITNVVGVAQVDTNRVVTNVVYMTNVVMTFDLHPRDSVESAIKAGGTVATVFGAPWIVPLLGLLGGIYGWWAEFRNKQKQKAIGVLTNNVQVGRETILATAGPATEAQFVDAISSAQVKADVKEMVSAVAENKVDKAEARNEAASVVSLAKRNPAPPNGH